MGQRSNEQLKESIETYMCVSAQRNQSKKRYMKRKVVSQESHCGLKAFSLQVITMEDVCTEMPQTKPLVQGPVLMRHPPGRHDLPHHRDEESDTQEAMSSARFPRDKPFRFTGVLWPPGPPSLCPPTKGQVSKGKRSTAWLMMLPLGLAADTLRYPSVFFFNNFFKVFISSELMTMKLACADLGKYQ